MTPQYDAMQRWLKRRDPDAFRTLVLAHAGLVYGTCKRILNDATEAEDVAQECFLALATLDRAPTHSIGAWLHGVATKRSAQRVRNESRRRKREARAALDMPQSVEPSWDDLIEHVDQAIAELPPTLHAPLVEYFLEGHTQREIARSLNIPERTISLRIAQAVDHVRAALRKRGITVSATALTSLCLQHIVAAAPTPLIASLGKLALASPVRGAATGTLIATTGIATGVKVIAATTLITLILFGYWWNQPKPVVRNSADIRIATQSLQPEKESPPSQPVVTSAGPPKETVAPPPDPPAEPGRVTGLVMTADEQPVPNAEVMLSVVIDGERDDDIWRLNESYARRLRFMKATSDYNGRYVFDAVPFFGKGEIVAHAVGKLGQRRAVEVTSAAETVVPTLIVREAIAVHGIISDRNRAPLDSALVTVQYAWRTRGDSYLPVDRAITDNAGRFTVWVDPKTEWISLRAISPAIGQCYFPNLAVGSSPLTLREPALATLYGNVTALNADTTNVRMVVTVVGELPEPELSIWHSGIRASVKHDASLDSLGNYRITTLYPGLNYRAFVYKADPTDGRRKISLLPQQVNFVFEEGESREWNPGVSSPIVFTGTVQTEISKLPAPGIYVYVLKDGKTIRSWYGDYSDEEGRFRVDAVTGPGQYQIVAYHGRWPDSGISDDHMRRFAKSYNLKGGEIIEVDLPIYEPAIMPLRIVDDIGNPVKSIGYTVHITLPDGTNYSGAGSAPINVYGDLPFRIYTPATDFWMEIRPFNLDLEKPFVTPHFEITPGAILPEQVIVIDRLCGIKGRVTNSNGIPLRHTSLLFNSRFADGNEQRLQVGTDAEGMLQAESVLMPGTMDLRVSIFLAEPEFAPIELGTLEAQPGETIDFGDLVFTDAPGPEDGN